jgi:homocitrate synthase NifV
MQTEAQPLRLVDTTLRDGGQAPGLVLTLKARLFLARVLAEGGVGEIEAGIPAIGREEIESIRAIKENCPSLLISVWNRARPEDIRASFACEPNIIHICLPVSERQIRNKLGTDSEKALSMLLDCAELALSKGYTVSAGLEDASRADKDFLLRVGR